MSQFNLKDFCVSCCAKLVMKDARFIVQGNFCPDCNGSATKLGFLRVAIKSAKEGDGTAFYSNTRRTLTELKELKEAEIFRLPNYINIDIEKMLNNSTHG